MSSISILAYIILSLSIGYAFIYSSFNELSALTSERQKYDKSLQMVDSIENKKNELLTKFNDIPTVDKENIDTILPNSLNFVRLVSQIDAVAARHGISIDQISSRETNPSAAASPEEGQIEEIYQSAVIGFSFTATYDGFNAFVDDLEKSLRILDIRSVKLTTGDEGIYTYSVEFETYWLRPSNL